jgi:hypothetical protein
MQPAAKAFHQLSAGNFVQDFTSEIDMVKPFISAFLVSWG